MQPRISPLLFSVPAVFLVTTAVAQVTTAQKAGPAGSTLQQQGTVGQRQATTQQECGKPNAQGLVVPCPTKPGEGVAKPGAMTGSQGGVPSGSVPGMGSSGVSRAMEAKAPEGQRLGERQSGDKSQTKTMTVDQLGRDATLRSLTDPKTGGLSAKDASALSGKSAADQPLQGQGGRTLGGKTGTEVLKDATAGGTVSATAGKNQVSKQDQLGRNEYGGTNTMITSSGGVGIVRKRDADNVLREETVRDRNTNRETRTYYDRAAVPLREVVTELDTGKVVSDTAANRVGVPRSMGGTGVLDGVVRPVPDGAQVGGAPISPSDVSTARQRQIELQKEGQREKPMVSIGNPQQAIVGRRTDGLTQPADTSGSTSPIVGSKQSFQGKGPQPGDPSDIIGTGQRVAPSKPSPTGQ